MRWDLPGVKGSPCCSWAYLNICAGLPVRPGALERIQPRIWLQIPFKQEGNLAEGFGADMEGDLGIGCQSPKRSEFPLHTPSNPR